MTSVPKIRIREANQNPVNRQGDYVLYWMTAYRRIHWNFSLQRAVEWARELHKPLLIMEALRMGYPWACDRFHRFILEGMADNAHLLKRSGTSYYPYVEVDHDAGKGFLKALASKSCLVISDDYPAFFLPRMIKAAAKIVPVLMEQVDSNGLLPLRAVDRIFSTAYAFRRFLQKQLPSHLIEQPISDPLKGEPLPHLKSLPKKITNRWPTASRWLLKRDFQDHLFDSH